MKQQLLLWGIVLVLCACSTPKQLSLDDIFSSHFDHKMISSGNNFPDFNTRKDSIDLFLIALHEGHTTVNFQKKAGWDAATLQQKVTLLKSKKWLTPTSKLNPSIFIANDAQGKALMNYSLPLALEISTSIENELTGVKAWYEELAIAKDYEFEAMSFFILSNVLLDNWQINNVEQGFLKTNHRPERHGKYYYYALFENKTFPEEAFGIYGNQYHSMNDTLTVAVYGNNRLKVSKQLRENNFINELIQNAPVINKTDNTSFKSIAESFKPILLSVLERHRSYSEHVYETMGYAEAISFEEFFIWWYHFVYTQATNILADNDLVSIPEDGNFYYVLSN